MEAPVQVGAAKPLDIPGQETILLSEVYMVIGATPFARRWGCFYVLDHGIFIITQERE